MCWHVDIATGSQSTTIFVHSFPRVPSEFWETVIASFEQTKHHELEKALRESMEAIAVCSSRGVPVINSPRRKNLATYSPLLVQSMAAQKPLPFATKTVASKKVSASSTWQHSACLNPVQKETSRMASFGFPFQNLLVSSWFLTLLLSLCEYNVMVLVKFFPLESKYGYLLSFGLSRQIRLQNSHR